MFRSKNINPNLFLIMNNNYRYRIDFTVAVILITFITTVIINKFDIILHLSPRFLPLLH